MTEGINTSEDEKNPRVFPINKTRLIHFSVPLISLPFPPPPLPKKKLVITKKTERVCFQLQAFWISLRLYRSYKENSWGDTRDISTSLRMLPWWTSLITITDTVSSYTKFPEKKIKNFQEQIDSNFSKQ